MEHFPDRTVQEIVEGFEAAQRILAQALPLAYENEGFPLPSAILAERRVIDAAEERIRTLRLGRYLRPAPVLEDRPDGK